MHVVTTSDNRLIVVRAWFDSDRLIIRLLISAGPKAPAVESVFTDIAAATDRLADVLAELLDVPPAHSSRERSAEADTKR